eukprot:1109597-Prorocentrum_minimum.AAC.2
MPNTFFASTKRIYVVYSSWSSPLEGSCTRKSMYTLVNMRVAEMVYILAETVAAMMPRASSPPHKGSSRTAEIRNMVYRR